jgi:predicted RND superfamily exporter protein
LTGRSGWVLVAVVLLTAALAAPAVWLRPTSSASLEPDGPVFTANRLAAERFAPSVHRAVYLVESRDGDLLAREPLLELWRNTQALRRDAAVGSKLVVGTDPRSGVAVDGLASVADGVDALLRARGGDGLEAATDAEVERAVGELLSLRSADGLGLSAHAVQHADGRWSAPAAVVYLFADNGQLGGGGSTSMIGQGSEPKERFGRAALALLRGDQEHLRAWGIAIDVNLTSAEQGRAAGPFIGWTVLAVLLLVGVAFRSYWAVALCGAALGALMIWLQGLSNLLGLESSQILSTIVPIAMISFGIDFALHALGRYREHRRQGLEPRRALRVGFAGVLAALLLAAASDAAAFLSNTATGIEALVQFGLAAAAAQLSAVIILGIAVPLGLMRIEQRVGRRSPHPARAMAGLVGALLAALGAMAAVLLLVFVEPWQGVALLAAHLLIFVVVPALSHRRPAAAEQVSPARPSAAGGGWPWVGGLVVGLARRRAVVLPATIAVTLGCWYFAIQVEPRFDVRDFFSDDTDFVVGLERLEHHLGARGGEPALVFVETDLTQPAALAAVRAFRDRLAALPTDRLAKDERGQVAVDDGVVGVVAQALSSSELRAELRLADEDADGVPDEPAQLGRLFRRLSETGLPAAQERPARTPAAIAEVLWQSADRSRHATRVGVRLPGSGAQEKLTSARAELEPLVDQLRADLARVDPRAQALLTGPPVVRQASLEAVLQAFRLSLPVAVLLCFLVAAAFMRSLRYALVSIVPIVLVVAWLYAAMYGLDMAINVVSATIGAVSIGIGIDFAVHFTMRYREERSGGADVEQALRRSGRGTGTALLTSAASSIVGFGILALAPMPLFASYGLLTALMLAMAAVATLVVLPSLLVLSERLRW